MPVEAVLADIICFGQPSHCSDGCRPMSLSLEAGKIMQYGTKYSVELPHIGQRPIRRPNLFLIGAPKCGTTSLALWLSEHSKIFLPKIKEPHFFRNECVAINDKLSQISIQQYESLFVNASSSASIICDASTSYLFHGTKVLPKIIKYNDQAKFLVCLRNPVEMAISLHAELLWNGEEDKSDFLQAWKLHPKRRVGAELPRGIIDPAFCDYYSVCRLGEQVRTVFDILPRERVHFVFLEDMQRYPERTYAEVLAFLGLESEGAHDFPSYNQRKARRSQWLKTAMNALVKTRRQLGIHRGFGILNTVDRLNRAVPTKTTIDPPVAELLRSTFADDIRLLGELVGRDLQHWLAVG